MAVRRSVLVAESSGVADLSVEGQGWTSVRAANGSPYEFLDFGSNNTNVQGFGGTLKGDYDPNNAHFIAFTARHKF